MGITKKNITCRACKTQNAAFLMDGQLLKEEIKYYECANCLYVQTEEPYWLEKAYSNAINASDTGILRRNQANAKLVISTLFLLGNTKGKIVDCAGGYGILVRLLRDYGVDAYWSDPYCENLLSKGFEYQNGNATLVTAFEAFEHFVSPLEELEKLLTIAPNVLLSTELISNPAPSQNNWWYYGKEHGQHIGFFRRKTLEVMAKNTGKKLISDGRSYHLFTESEFRPSLWKATQIVAKIFPHLITWKLTSKTWEDHYKMADDAP